MKKSVLLLLSVIMTGIVSFAAGNTKTKLPSAASLGQMTMGKSSLMTPARQYNFSNGVTSRVSAVGYDPASAVSASSWNFIVGPDGSDWLYTVENQERKQLEGFSLSVFSGSAGEKYPKAEKLEHTVKDVDLKKIAFIVITVGVVILAVVFALVLMKRSKKTASAGARKAAKTAAKKAKEEEEEKSYNNNKIMPDEDDDEDTEEETEDDESEEDDDDEEE